MVILALFFEESKIGSSPLLWMCNATSVHDTSRGCFGLQSGIGVGVGKGVGVGDGVGATNDDKIVLSFEPYSPS